MKVMTIVFIAIGILYNFIYTPVSFLFGEAILWSVLGIVFGVISLVSLCDGRKQNWIGICTLIFTSTIGGILYLCLNENVFGE